MSRFKELRIKNGFKTQQDLARVLFVNQTAVSQWERGVTLPSPPLLLKLSELYGVPVDYLLGKDGADTSTAEDIKKQPTGETDGLSKEESSLLSLFRGLSPDQQEMVVRMVQAAADQQRG